MHLSHICSQITTFTKAALPKTLPEAALLSTAVLSALLHSNGAGAAVGACYAGYKWWAGRKLEALPLPAPVPPNPPAPAAEEHEIERKQEQKDPTVASSLQGHPNIPQRPFSPVELSKIEALQKRNEVISITKVWNTETSAWESAYVIKRAAMRGRPEVAFRMYNFQDQLLGRAIVRPFPLTDPDYEDDFIGGMPDEYIGYGINPEQTDKIKLDELYTQEEDMQKNYKYKGKQLLTAIEQHYRDRFKSRIILEASYTSHGFYYKLGFRSVDESENSKIKEALLASERNGTATDTHHLNSVLMYLTDEARSQWGNAPLFPKPQDI